MKRRLLTAIFAFLLPGIDGQSAPPDKASTLSAIRSQIKNPDLGDACITSPDGDLIVVTSSYLAGGISGVFWKRKEYVDDAGHGGSLQYALVVDGIGSSYNPTEGGCKSDDYHFRRIGDDRITNVALKTDTIIGPVWATVPQTTITSTILQKFTATETTIHSQSRLAFWLAPKSSPDMWTDEQGVQHPAAPIATSSVTSNYILEKNITVAPDGLRNVIKLNAAITIQPIDDEIKKALANPATGVVGTKMQTSPTLSIDTPVVFLFNEFNKIYELVPGADSTAATLADISKSHGKPSKNDPHETTNPVIYTTPDDQHAIGVYAFPDEAGMPPTTYRTYVPGSAYSKDIYEWEATQHVPLGDKTVTLNYTAYLVVGTVSEVKTGLLALMKKYPYPATKPAAGGAGNK